MKSQNNKQVALKELSKLKINELRWNDIDETFGETWYRVLCALDLLLEGEFEEISPRHVKIIKKSTRNWLNKWRKLAEQCNPNIEKMII